MRYTLKSDLETLRSVFIDHQVFWLWLPRASIEPTQYAPVVRLSSAPLLGKYELALLRYGLVPPGFSSTREADRYGLHAVRAKRTSWQREVAKLFNLGNRCLVPMTIGGELVAAAGLWGKWVGKNQRVESFAVFTVKNHLEEWVPLVLPEWDWAGWIEGELLLEVLTKMPPMVLVSVH
jgi:putative SOS response-associated peptidase YedK